MTQPEGVQFRDSLVTGLQTGKCCICTIQPGGVQSKKSVHEQELEREKATQAVKITPHWYEENGAI